MYLQYKGKEKMRMKKKKEDRKTETLSVRISEDTKEAIMQMSEGTQAKTIVSVIEDFAEAYKNGAWKPGQWIQEKERSSETK